MPLVTAKIYRDDLHSLKGIKRNVGLDEKEPSVAQLIHAAIETCMKRSGTVARPEDLKTIAERRLLKALTTFDVSNDDPVLKEFIYKKMGLEAADLTSLKTLSSPKKRR
jgi:hypothetical protein